MQDDFSADVETAHTIIRHNIKRMREIRDKSQLDMGLSIGHASAGFYGKAEIGIQNKRFNIEYLVKIAKVLECDICEFFKPIDMPTQSGS